MTLKIWWVTQRPRLKRKDDTDQNSHCSFQFFFLPSTFQGGPKRWLVLVQHPDMGLLLQALGEGDALVEEVVPVRSEGALCCWVMGVGRVVYWDKTIIHGLC